MQPLTAVLLSIFITVAITPIMIRVALRFRIVDAPDSRKVHSEPIPRIGGAAMAAGALIPIVICIEPDDFMRAYILGMGVIVSFGLVDDMRGLRYYTKFAGQILAAGIIIFYGGLKIASLGALIPGDLTLPDWAAFPLTMTAIVGVINAINLADGLDGLAGGITLLGLSCIAYLAFFSDQLNVLIVALALSGAIFGFLRFNTHPARLFMGDTGSQLLGFSTIVLALHLTQTDRTLSPMLPLIILGFPILDTLTVMVERISHGRSPFYPDKNHFHHRLLRLGLYHSEAVFVIYLIQGALVASAMLLKYFDDRLLLLGYIVFSVLVIASFTIADRYELRFKRYHLIDHIIKDRLKVIKNDQWIIGISFTVARFLIPFIFMVSCLMPERIDGYMAGISAGFLALIGLAWVFRRQYLVWCLRVAFYLAVPFILYSGKDTSSLWRMPYMGALYHMLFIIGAVSVMLTVRYSRRAKGFRTTTMDFLILFIAVAVPNLPNPFVQTGLLAELTMEIIVLFFSYEVLITELRGQYTVLAAFIAATMALITTRSVVGF